jgi:hypothetical protein
LRLRKERFKVIRGGVLDAPVEEIMERMEVFESSQDFVQETQFDVRELCYGQSPEDSLGFEDYMARTQHGARARYRNSQPTLHFNSNAHEGQHRGHNNAVGGSGGDRRYNLRGATTMRTQGIQGTSRMGEVGENINMGTQEGGDAVPESQEGVQGIQGRAAVKKTA